MYAVVKTGGKQYRVSEGDSLRVESLPKEIGETVELDQVLAVSQEGNLSVGAPYVENAVVSAEVVSHGREKKIEVLKFRRRKDSMTRQGHRQNYTEIKISAIKA